MGFVNWVKNHVRASVAIVVFPIALAICGGVMIASKVNYDNYIVKYEDDVLTTKANSPIDPLEVLINNDYTSKRASKYIANAEDFVLPEGKEVTDSIIEGLNDAAYEVKLTANFADKSYCDIGLTLATSLVSDGKPVATDDLLSVVSIKINGSGIIGSIKLDVDEDGEEVIWSTMIVRGIALPKGENIITIAPASSSGGVYMPKIQSAVVYADVNVTF